jgi:hypothetical protein
MKWQRWNPYKVGDPAQRAREHERALVEHPAPSEKVDRDGQRIGDAECDDGGRDDGIKRGIGAEENTAKDHIESDGQDESV